MRPLSLLATFILFLFAPNDAPAQNGEDQNIDSIAGFDFENETIGDTPANWIKKGSDQFTVAVTDEEFKAGSSCLKISSTVKSPPGAPVGAVSYQADRKKCNGRKIRLRASVKADFKDNGQVTMWLREDLKSGEYGVFEKGMDNPITTSDWKVHEIVAELSDDVKALTVGFLMFGEGNVFVDDVAIQIAEDSDSSTVDANGKDSLNAAPGIFQIKGAMKVSTIPNGRWSKLDDIQLLLPLPLRHRDQYPLTYNLNANPASALKSVRIYEDKPSNFVAEVVLSGVARLKEVDLEFESAVLVAPSSFGNVPESVEVPDSWPEVAEPWLASTWCVNSSHPRIRMIANGIRKETDDVLQVIEQIEKRARNIFDNASGQAEDLTAVTALNKRGSCTSRGNLVAALLRASNIPARVLAGYPSWSGPLQTHYIVEAYVPEFGWYPIESTKCRSPWPNEYQISVSIVPPEYEAKTLAGNRTGVAGGVPYLSLTEIANNDGNFRTQGAIPDHPYCDHVCQFVRPIDIRDDGWEKAKKMTTNRWNEWLNSDIAVQRGKIQFGPMTDRIEGSTIESLLDELTP